MLVFLMDKFDHELVTGMMGRFISFCKTSFLYKLVDTGEQSS